MSWPFCMCLGVGGRGREVGMVMFTSRLIAFCVGIYNTEFVMTGVIRQRLEYEAYPIFMCCILALAPFVCG